MKLKNMAIPVGTLLLGVIIGSAANGGDETSVSADAPTVTKTVTKEGPTKTVEVSKIPDVCLTALDEADYSMSLAGDGFILMSEGFEAISYGDLYGLESTVTELDSLYLIMEPALTDYRNSAAECRSLSSTT